MSKVTVDTIFRGAWGKAALGSAVGMVSTSDDRGRRQTSADFIVHSVSAARVAATVSMISAYPAVAAAVRLLSADIAAVEPLLRPISASNDKNGRFQLQNVGPGDYLASGHGRELLHTRIGAWRIRPRVGRWTRRCRSSRCLALGSLSCVDNTSYAICR